MGISYNKIIQFWFNEIPPVQRWKKDSEFDLLIASRFGVIHNEAEQGKLESWRSNALGSLAEIIILDQFSRNIYRETPKAFANDDLALKLAKDAIEKGYDQELDTEYLSFLYMPFMHSEKIEVHMEAVNLFYKPGMEEAYKYELKHKVIIEKFGRYPHRNKILGRKSTDEEIKFLKDIKNYFW